MLHEASTFFSLNYSGAHQRVDGNYQAGRQTTASSTSGIRPNKKTLPDIEVEEPPLPPGTDSTSLAPTEEEGEGAGSELCELVVVGISSLEILNSRYCNENEIRAHVQVLNLERLMSRGLRCTSIQLVDNMQVL